MVAVTPGARRRCADLICTASGLGEPSPPQCALPLAPGSWLLRTLTVSDPRARLLKGESHGSTRPGVPHHWGTSVSDQDGQPVADKRQKPRKSLIQELLETLLL